MNLKIQDAKKFLELLISPCEDTSDHSWRHCARCLAIHELETRSVLTVSFIKTAINTLMLQQADPPAGVETRRDAFYVVEQFVDNKSRGYWNGGSSRSFVRDIDAAMQFCRRVDAQRAISGWHWRDVKITEHVMIEVDPPPEWRR